MKNNRYQTREEINQIRRTGDYRLVSDIIKGVYTPETIRKMLDGNRTLQPSVVDGFNKLFSMRERLVAE